MADTMLDDVKPPRAPEPETAAALEALDLAVAVSRGAPPPAAGVTASARVAAPALGSAPPAEVRRRLDDLLVGDHVQPALQWLHDSGILAVTLPEMEATVDFTQEMGRRHKDVWEHTKQVVAQAAPLLPVRWGALLHDIGKVPTRAVTPAGKVTFHGHAEVGARMFRAIARRLAFPRELREEVRFLIRHHLRASQYSSAWTDSAVRRFELEMRQHLDHLVLLSRADITSARRHKREAARRRIDELMARVAAIRELDARVPPLPSGLGNAIMARFDVPPGRLIGDLKRELLARVERGELEPGRDDAYYLAALETSPLLAGRG